MDHLVAVRGLGIVDPGRPVLRADDYGLTRGDGCFETCRLLTDADGRSVVQDLDAHLDRLARSVDALDIVVDLTDCRSLLEEAATGWPDHGEAAIKIMVTRGPEGGERPSVIVTIRPIGAESLRQRSEGVRVVTLDRGTSAEAYARTPWLLGGVKSLSYALNMAALREAIVRGAEDAIWVSSDAMVLEAPTATVLWTFADSPALHTTPIGASGILSSTTMARLAVAAERDGLKTETALLPAAALAATASLWLVSSVRGVAEVVSVNGVARARDVDLTRRMQQYAGF
ncbi:MAG: aminotransferase class IV [bacterium]